MQWANSAFSILLGEPSVTGVIDTVTGYPEIGYFNRAYVNKTLIEAGNQQLADNLL